MADFFSSQIRSHSTFFLTLQHGLNSFITLTLGRVQEQNFTMEDGKSVGIIGMGDMGKMYARRLSSAGWK